MTTVRTVDKTAGKFTRTLGPLTNLGMPEMNRAICVKDTPWLDQVKEGDIIRIVADKRGSGYIVAGFEPANQASAFSPPPLPAR